MKENPVVFFIDTIIESVQSERFPFIAMLFILAVAGSLFMARTLNKVEKWYKEE